MTKTQEDFFNKICTSHFIARVRKGCVGFYCERELETEQKLQYFDPHSYGRHCCVFLVLQGCSTGGPGTHSAGWWLSLLHLISIFSGPQLIRAPSPFGLGWLSPPHLVSNCSAIQLARNRNSTSSSNSTELYNRSTPTRSLKSNVKSSLSGNNCHAVQRSLSSGASVYECTMGIFLARPISSANFRPRDFVS